MSNNSTEISLDDIEKELAQEIKFIENMIDKEEVEIEIEGLEIEEESDKPLSLKEKLEQYIESEDEKLGGDIISECKKKLEEPDLDENCKFCVDTLQILVKASLKYKEVKSLLIFICDNIDIILSNKDSKRKKEVLEEVKKRYQGLKKATTPSTPTSSQKFNIDSNLVNKLISLVEERLDSKLQEINIKIEENQRFLQNISFFIDKYLKSRSEVEDTDIEDVVSTDIERGEIKEEQEFIERKFGVVAFNGDKYLLPDDLIMNTYKISSKKAEKLAKRMVVKFDQLKGFFSSLEKGLKEELKNRDDLKDLFLYVLQPEGKTEKGYRFAVVVKIPDTEEYGVFFVKDVKLKNLNVSPLGDVVDTEEGALSVLDIKSIWLKKQIELGMV